jgi:hypothetical protein
MKYYDKFIYYLATGFVLLTSINVALYKISPELNILSYFIN